LDSEQRIHELERQVEELQGLVQGLIADRDAHGKRRHRRHRDKPPRPKLRDHMRQGVQKALKGEAGDTLETRIGAIWLSRTAVVLLMTAIVLGARYTVSADIGPIQKLAIVYAASALALGYGWLRWGTPDLFAQTLLGTGLAGNYYATYAAFFVDGMRVSDSHWPAIPLLAGCFVVLVSVCHRRQSQSVAGLAMFLVYYTVVASCMGGQDAASVYYALATCSALAVVASVFHARHRWLLFTWAALIATYLTHMFYFVGKPAGLDIAPHDYFWLSNGFLAVCFIAFSVVCILDAHKTGEYRRKVAPLSGTNSAVFLTLTWLAVRENYLEQEWLFRLGLAALLLMFAAAAQATGPKRNYLFQIFLAKAVIMFTLALQAYFSGDKLMVALAIESLALAFSYKRSGLVSFKAMGLILLLSTFVGCMFHLKTPGTVSALSVSIPANWLCCAGAAAVFVVVAWFYEHFVRKTRPEDRVTHSQWFLADTVLDIHSGTAALLYAAAAAIILLTLTIIDLGTAPHLPFVLAGIAAIMTLAGIVLKTSPVDFGGILLLVAAHVCYHALILLKIPGFEQQPHYAAYTILVALFTYAGAYLMERYLKRIRGGREWAHHVVAAIPYLAATLLLTTLSGRVLSGVTLPLAQNVLGVGILLAGAVTAYPAVKASGLFALGIGTWTLYQGLSSPSQPYFQKESFLTYFVLILLTYALAERLFVTLQRQERVPSTLENRLRTMLVCAGAALGIYGLDLYSSSEYLTLSWLALAVITVGLGAVFQEIRYRWTALALFCLITIRAFAIDLRLLSLEYAFLSFAVVAAAFLVITWLYSRYRQKQVSSKTSGTTDPATDA